MYLGVPCVDNLKERTGKEWANLFATETIIIQKVATRVFAGLKKEGGLDPMPLS